MGNNFLIHEFGIDNIILVNRYKSLHLDCPNAYIQQSIQWSKVIKDEGPDFPIFLLME